MNNRQQHNLQEESFSSPAFMQDEQPSLISISDFLYILKHNWYWFLLSLVIALIGMGIYLGRTPYTYEREACVLVESEGGIPSVLSAPMQLSGMDIKANSAVENEIVILKTKRIISQVIEDLNLRVDYLCSEGLRKKLLYKKDTPIALQLGELGDDFEGSMEIDFLDDNKLRLHHFDGDFKEYISSNEIISTYDQPIATKKGTFFIRANELPEEVSSPKQMYVHVASTEKATEHYSQLLSVQLIEKGTTIISLKLKNENPLLAEDFLNTLIEEHRNISRFDKVRIARNTENFVNDRLLVIGKELGSVDEEIEHFKQANQIASITREAEEYVKGTAQLTEKMVEINNQLSIAKFLKDYLVSPEHRNDLIPANVGLSDVSANSLISEYNTLLLRRDQLMAESSEKSPIIETLSGQMASLHKAIVKTVDNLVASLDIRLASIQRETNTNEGRISSIPTQERIIGSIYRNQKIKEELYLFLLNARERNALNIEAAEANTRLIQPATGSSQPIAPKESILLLAAVIVGLLLPAGVLYVRIISSNKVRGRKDLETYTQVPILGEIPHSESKEKKIVHTFKKVRRYTRDKKKRQREERAERRNHLFSIQRNERDIVSEAFSVLRANMMFMLPEREGGQVIMTTSAVPGSGKTFVTANLGLCLSMLQNKRVLVVDVDIRKKSLTDALRPYLSGMTDGLTSYLMNPAILPEEIIVPANNKVLFDFIPSLKTPPNPVELLDSDRFEELIEQLRGLYDYIILDSVPFLSMADAQVTNRVADLSIMLVREGNLPRELLGEIQKAYRERRFHNMALILNDAGISGKMYGHSYGYAVYKTYGAYGSKEYNEEI